MAAKMTARHRTKVEGRSRTSSGVVLSIACPPALVSCPVDHRLTEALCHDKTVSKCLSTLLQYVSLHSCREQKDKG